MEELEKEIKVLKTLRNKHIISLLDYFLPKSFESFLELDPFLEPPFLALELAPFGDFFDLTVSSEVGFEEEISKFYSG